MKPFVWKEGMSDKETADGAYWERNMLALLLATVLKDKDSGLVSGYYYHGEWPGWARVISIANGRYTFHIPDDFDIGMLNLIEPNWDGHTTEQKWNDMMLMCGVVPLKKETVQ